MEHSDVLRGLQVVSGVLVQCFKFLHADPTLERQSPKINDKMARAITRDANASKNCPAQYVSLSCSI